MGPHVVASEPMVDQISGFESADKEDPLFQIHLLGECTKECRVP